MPSSAHDRRRNDGLPESAASLRGRVERDAGGFDKLLQRGRCARPQDATAGDDDRPLCRAPFSTTRSTTSALRRLAAYRVARRGAATARWIRRHRRTGRLPASRGRPVPAFPTSRGERRGRHIRNARRLMNSLRPLRNRPHHGDLVDLLERAGSKCADGARASERHHGRAIDQRVGETQGQVDGAGSGSAHAKPGTRARVRTPAPSWRPPAHAARRSHECLRPSSR